MCDSVSTLHSIPKKLNTRIPHTGASPTLVLFILHMTIFDLVRCHTLGCVLTLSFMLTSPSPRRSQHLKSSKLHAASDRKLLPRNRLRLESKSHSAPSSIIFYARRFLRSQAPPTLIKFYFRFRFTYYLALRYPQVPDRRTS